MKKNWYEMRQGGGGKPPVVAIYGGIGDYEINASSFFRDLKSVAKDGDNLEIHVNSPGGDVFNGLAIYNILKNWDGHVTTFVDGLAASIAGVIAIAGDTVVMPENAMFMIHNPFGCVKGDAEHLREQADVLDKIAGQLASIYARKSGQSEEEVRKAMDATTWMSGKEAFEAGYADKLQDSVSIDVSAWFNPENISMRFSGTPYQQASNDTLVSALNGLKQAINHLTIRS